MGHPQGLASTVAITLDACHVVDVLQEAFKRHGQPEIVNADQGSKCTARAFVHAVKDRGCHLSMDGLAAWRDNVFVDRLWKSVNMSGCIYMRTIQSLKPGSRSCNILQPSESPFEPGPAHT
ncbi:MAG: hypothetical protein ABIU05_23200 [Nitrospirales bacterium]